MAYYSPHLGLRTWDITDLMNEQWYSTHGYELILQDMADEWVIGQDNEILFWAPVKHKKNLCMPSPRIVLGGPQWKATRMDFSVSRLCRKWTECIDKKWLRELKQKEKEVENLLE